MMKIFWGVLITLWLGTAVGLAEELFDAEAAQQHFNAGLNLYFQQNYQGAIKEFEEAARINPENANAYYFIGYSYYKLREFEKAKEMFDQAYEVDNRYSPIGNTQGKQPPQEQE